MPPPGSSSEEALARSACTEAAQQLALCVEKTACVQNGGSIMECMRSKGADGGACEKYRIGYYHCRRQQLDMRSRIWGRSLGSETGEGD